jgi:DNA-binding GntR family transcriptional regulator
MALRDRVVLAIRDAIVQGRLRPGEKVPEDDLARQLSVSRTPIREAIRVLEQQGLVTVSPQRGTYIAMPDASDAVDSQAVRAALEILAVEQAIDRSDVGEWRDLCDELELLLKDMAATIESNDVIQLTELDIKFHATLVRASKNQYLWRSWHVVGIPFLIWSPDREQDLPGMVERHHTLFAAIRTRDLELCTAAIKSHVTRAPL